MIQKKCEVVFIRNLTSFPGFVFRQCDGTFIFTAEFDGIFRDTPGEAFPVDYFVPSDCRAFRIAGAPCGSRGVWLAFPDSRACQCWKLLRTIDSVPYAVYRSFDGVQHIRALSYRVQGAAAPCVGSGSILSIA